MKLVSIVLLSVALARGQARPEQKPLMAEQVFKNIQVLKGIPASQFMATMGFFSASLGMNCTDCHGIESAGNWDKYADETDKKRTARRMMVMMSAINKSYFGGRRMVTCYSCHRGGERPRVTPSLAELYGPPPVEEPDEIRQQAPNAPSADQILAKYIEAIGGVQRLASLTSLVAKGTYQGYADTDKHPVEILPKLRVSARRLFIRSPERSPRLTTADPHGPRRHPPTVPCRCWNFPEGIWKARSLMWNCRFQRGSSRRSPSGVPVSRPTSTIGRFKSFREQATGAIP